MAYAANSRRTLAPGTLPARCCAHLDLPARDGFFALKDQMRAPGQHAPTAMHPSTHLIVVLSPPCQVKRGTECVLLGAGTRRRSIHHLSFHLLHAWHVPATERYQQVASLPYYEH